MHRTPTSVIARSTAVSCDEAISVLIITVNSVRDRFASAFASARDDKHWCHRDEHRRSSEVAVSDHADISTWQAEQMYVGFHPRPSSQASDGLELQANGAKETEADRAIGGERTSEQICDSRKARAD